MNVYKESIARNSLARAVPLWALILFLSSPAHAFEMEMGAVTLNDTFSTPTWTTVSFAQPFTLRPVVVALPTTDGSDPATIRVRNVTTAGFDITQVEPNANDGPHVAMSTAYLAIEPGSHLLPDGSRIIALEHSTNSFANRLISTTWDTVGFPASFNGVPTIVAGVQTVANEQQTPPASSSVPFLDVGIRNAGTTQLQVTLERAESTAGSVTFNERIGIIAIESNINLSFTDAFGNTIQLQSLLTTNNIRGFDNGCFTNSYAAPFAATPLAVASANSRFGNNGGWVRRCSQSSGSIGLTIDEDIDNDSERSHIGETAGIIAASAAFHANLGVDLQVSKDVSVFADPINGTTNPYSIPEADMQYVIAIANLGSGSPDANSLVVTDDIPSDLRLCVSTLCQTGGPVVLDVSASPVPPGVTLGSVTYSNDGGSSFIYSPVPDTDGYDPVVDAIQITMTGQLASIDPLGAPSFNLILIARIN